jgi:hypothetical protein
MTMRRENFARKTLTAVVAFLMFLYSYKIFVAIQRELPNHRLKEWNVTKLAAAAYFTILLFLLLLAAV